jgi:hypothetical protein
LLSDRDLRVVREHEAGDTYQSIGERHGITRQYAHLIVSKARQHVDSLELDLLRAKKTGEHPTLLVPFGPDYTLAQDYLQFCRDQLRARGVRVKVRAKQTKEGTAFQLEEETYA